MKRIGLSWLLSTAVIIYYMNINGTVCMQMCCKTFSYVHTMNTRWICNDISHYCSFSPTRPPRCLLLVCQCIVYLLCSRCAINYICSGLCSFWNSLSDVSFNPFISLRMYNSLVERCFTDCVDTFRRKTLDKQEETCVKRCAEKFLKHSMRVGMRFAELNQGAATQD